MSSLNEALARERMTEAHRRASAERVASHLVAARRWRRVERLARSAYVRHARRVDGI